MIETDKAPAEAAGMIETDKAPANPDPEKKTWPKNLPKEDQERVGKVGDCGDVGDVGDW